MNYNSRQFRFIALKVIPLLSSFPLHPRLLQTLDALGLSEATPIQQQAIPVALERRDLIASAETGSGKTFAFLLPTLDHLLNTTAPGSGTRVLILVPTRELAHQIIKQGQKLTRSTRLQIGLITGGESFKYQRALFRKNPEIIVATPGRLLEHLEQGTPDFSELEVLVLDEADRMLDMGFSEDVLTITGQCNKARQTLLFSATLSHRGLKGMTDTLLRDPATITLSTVRDRHGNIIQQIIPADDKIHKRSLLAWLLQHETYDKALVFTNTRLQADALGPELRNQGLRAGVLHGDMSQDERNQVMAFLRQGTIKVLVATDVAARGLDIKGVDLVINFDMARSGKDYVHRIGRTGRAGKQGLAISLIAHQEWNLMTGIERYLKHEFERRTIQEIAGKYRGPKKLKNSGKAAGGKKKSATDKAEKNQARKPKQRLRDQKNIGKRRKPSAGGTTDTPREAGHKPLTRKTVKPVKPD
ncbi:DEAD/DEAH box helicase [Sedimenticola selenatireducens]|uniref:DEAD/DEAH box helicase n=1 Tax=Sedimenticola selenatireducens TaxID=191960 RepID=UPI003F4AABBA